MNTDNLERKLQQRNLRQVPAEWRDEILLAAHRAIERDAERLDRSLAPSNRELSGLGRLFTSLLWPSPKAWGALAAVWLVIAGINLSLREPGKAIARADAKPSPEAMAQLEQQRRLLAELMGRPPLEAEWKFSPRPHSERRDETVCV